MGVLHNGENSNKDDAIFSGVRFWSCTPFGSPNLNTESCPRNIDEDEVRHQLRLKELEALDNKHLQAQQHIEFYQARIYATYNKKVKVWTFKNSNLILAVKRPIIMTHRSKKIF